MKKIFSLVLALALMLALTSCDLIAGTSSSTVESSAEVTSTASAEESTPESTADPRPLRDGAYIFDDAIEFEVYDGLTYEYSSDGALSVGFTIHSLITPSLTFLPAEEAVSALNESIVEQRMEEYIHGNGNQVISIYTVTKFTLDDQTVWLVNADAESNDPYTISYTYWVCQPNNTGLTYTWVYMAIEGDFNAYYPNVQTMVDSIRFI
jgi:hypothetical protein